MAKPVLRPFEKFTQLYFQKFEGYSPSSFSTELTILEKMNKTIHRLNEITGQWNDLVDLWREVMEWVLGEGLTDAVKDRLDELVEDGTLADLINETLFKWMNENKASNNANFKRSIKVKVPLKFPHWQQFANENGGARLYPQSFAVDYVERELFVMNSPTNTNLSTQRMVSVFDFDTGAYKTCFGAGNAGGEGLVVKRVNNTRYLYAKTRNHFLGRYNIDVLPNPMAILEPTQEYAVDVEWQFNEMNDQWIFASAGVDYGSEYRKTSFVYTNQAFNRIGALFTEVDESGYFNSPYESLFTKRQGVALGNGKIYFGMGGYVEYPSTSYYGYYGVRVLSNSGEIIDGGLSNPKIMADILKAKGHFVSRIENEGVNVDKETGAVYSLCVTASPDNVEAEQEGIIIFREFSPTKDAIDFSSAGANMPQLNSTRINSAMYPRSFEGKLINPLTGAEFKTVEQMADFMINTSITFFRFHSSANNITSAYFGGNIPSGRLVEIVNINNDSLLINYNGNASEREVKTQLYKSGGSWVEGVVFDNRWMDIPLASGITTFYENAPVRIIVSNYIKMMEGTLQGLIGKQLPFRIGTLPARARPFFNKTALISLSASGQGGYGVIQILSSGEVNLVYLSRETDLISLDGVTFY